MPGSDDDVCQCGHPRREHLKIEDDYYECARTDCECEDYQTAGSGEPAMADEEDEEEE